MLSVFSNGLAKDEKFTIGGEVTGTDVRDLLYDNCLLDRDKSGFGTGVFSVDDLVEYRDGIIASVKGATVGRCVVVVVLVLVVVGGVVVIGASYTVVLPVVGLISNPNSLPSPLVEWRIGVWY